MTTAPLTGTAPPRTFPVQDPATLQVLAHVPDATPADGAAAADRAAAAFATWSRTPPRARSQVLRRAFELLLRDQNRLAELISQENGKSLTDALGEVTYAAEFFRWFSEEAVRTAGEYGEAPAGGTRTLVHAKAVGVAALVTPWNFPAAMATRKIAPALAAGCTVLLKPASETPLTALAVAELLCEAGVPDGVVEVVPTTDAAGVVSTWLADPRVRKISFTGSTGVGRHLLRLAAERVLNASMELGGNAPFVVLEDADVEAAVAGLMVAKFRGGGQACTAANRIYVHRSLLQPFTQRLADEVTKLTVGPAADGAAIGPLISRAAVDRVRASVDAAVRAGARVAAQAAAPSAPGHFFPPTVLADVPADAVILREEIFGPVAPLVAWDDQTEVLRLVNDTDYGLAAYVYGRDAGRAIRFGEQIEAGMVGINRGLVSDPAAPFGGVKQSGLGREGARDGLREFQETQYVSVDWPA